MHVRDAARGARGPSGSSPDRRQSQASTIGGAARHGVRTAEQVALPVHPPLLDEHPPLGLGLDALRDAGQVQALRQPRDPGGERVRRAVALGEVADEAAVELDAGHGQVAQQGDGREAGAEVVDLHADAEVAQRDEVRAGAVEQGQDGGLGDLDDEARRVDAVPSIVSTTCSSHPRRGQLAPRRSSRSPHRAVRVGREQRADLVEQLRARSRR